jgi:hypothetical protein
MGMRLKKVFCGLALISSGLLVSACQTADLKIAKTGSGVDTFTIKQGERAYNGFYMVNDDCSSPRTPTVKVISGPSHGTIDISSGSGFPTFAAGERRYKCNSRKVPKIIVSYTPAPGFVGADAVVVSHIVAGSDSSSYVNMRFNVTK